MPMLVRQYYSGPVLLAADNRSIDLAHEPSRSDHERSQSERNILLAETHLADKRLDYTVLAEEMGKEVVWIGISD